MKKIFTMICLTLSICGFAQVKIGSPGSPNPNAVLELDGTGGKGILLPRVTKAEREAMTNVPPGLMVYQTDGLTVDAPRGLYYCLATSNSSYVWAQVSNGGNYWSAYTGNPAHVVSNNSGNIGIGTGAGGFQPAMKLDVLSSNGNVAQFGNAQQLANNVSTGIYLRQGQLLPKYTGAIIATGTSATEARLGFYTGSDANADLLNERLSISNAGYVGIGNTSPNLGGLVVDNKVGAVNSIFGSNTFGVAIESNYPGIGFNSYFNNGRKAINTGFGSLVGQDPVSGRFYIQTSAASVTGQGTPVNTIDRLSIKPNGNIGIQGNTDPQSPLSFSNDLGEKISFYNGSATSKYGIGVQGSKLQFYTTNASDVFQFGYGTSSDAAGFTETMRIQNDGKVGIGTDAPISKLHVKDNSNATAIQASQSGTGVGLYANAGNNNAIFAVNNGTSPTARFINFGSNSTALTTSGKVGINNADPQSPLSFENTTGEKINFFDVSPSSKYGIGVQGSQLQLYTGGGGDAISFGYGSSAAFTEKVKIQSGYVVLNNGRIRFNGQYSVGNSSGIEFTGMANNSALRGFIGQYDDNNIGMFGYGGGGWGFLYDVNDGSLKIGTTQKATGYLVNVGGKIIAEEVRVQIRSAWPDYVFSKNYKLPSLNEIEKYITANNHLPNVPAAADVEKSGIALGEMQTKMMEKIEELTLYIIELEKKVAVLSHKK